MPAAFTDLSADAFREVRRLFDAVMEADEATAARLLRRLETDAPDQHAALLGLLDAHRSASDAWEQPGWAHVMGRGSVWATEPIQVGERVGAYVITRKVGEGGMGAVFEAERADAAYTTRVAIKTLATGVSSAALMRRFVRERQILAQLTHPHIASLVDGGATERGVPYLVMEFVDGQPLDAHCQQRRLTIPERLDLFRQVCQAVEFAHRNLVIHRDLKPGNMLVTTEGQVKLLDFGIATLVRQDDTHEATRTQGAMTLAYASPEQLRGDPITTATDIYSLGVVLYRLLAGTAPHRLEGLPLLEAARTVTEGSAPRPSDVTTDEQARACGLRDAAALRRLLRAGLDDIVLMALRPEPARRYATVTALANDLHLYLRGMMVSARPETLGYRLSTFAKRRRALVAAGTIATLSLLGGTAVAIRQAQVARTEARRAQTVTRYLSGIVGAADPTHYTAVRTGKLDVGLMEVLDSTRSSIGRELDAEPRIRADLYWSMGNAYRAFGRHELALQLHDSAVALHTATVGAQSVEVARDITFRANTLQQMGRFDTAATSLREALRRYQAMPAAPDTEVTTVIAALGQILALALNEPEESERLSRDAIARLRAEPRTRHALLGMSHTALAGALGNQGKRAAADSHYVAALAAYDRDSVRERGARAIMLTSWGLARSVGGDYAGGADLKRRALRDLRAVGGDGISTVRTQVMLIDDLLRMKRPSEAETEARAALQALASLETTHDLEQAQLHRQRGLAELRMGRPADAARLLGIARRALDNLQGAARVSPSIRLLQAEAELAEARGQARDAEALHRNALAIAMVERGPAHPTTLASLGLLGAYYRRTGRPSIADSVMRDSAARATGRH